MARNVAVKVAGKNTVPKMAMMRMLELSLRLAAAISLKSWAIFMERLTSCCAIKLWRIKLWASQRDVYESCSQSKISGEARENLMRDMRV